MSSEINKSSIPYSPLSERKQTMTAVIQAALRYKDHLWVTLPLETGSKKPKETGWAKRTLDKVNPEEDFAANDNIGVLLGTPSNDIADIDLDCEEAVRAASHFLPETNLRFGRTSNPNSHWLYQVRDSGSPIKFSCQGIEGPLVEYRANGQQTMFPPSVHPSGETVVFSEDDEPTRIDRAALVHSVSHLAAASLLAKHWSEGRRHDMALAVSGALLRADWISDDVEDFISGICLAACDPELKDRVATVFDTEARMEAELPTTGLPSLRRLAGDTVVDRIVEWLSLNNGNTPGIGHNSRPASEAVLRCSDIGNANAFSNDNIRTVRYSYDMGYWFAWDGWRWTQKSSAIVDRVAENTVRAFSNELGSITDFKEQEAFLKWIKQSGNKQRLTAMVHLARHLSQLDQEKLDGDPFLLNAKGVAINLKDGSVKENERDDFCTKVINVVHDPSAECPLFMKFLDRIMDGSEPLKKFVQRAIGYSLSGSTKEQCFFIAHGSGANGKSTLLNLVRDMMGDYALNIPMDTLMTKSKGGGIPNDIARLRGARMVTAAEGEAKQKLAESLVKQLTGGDAMTARFLFQEFFDFTPAMKIWLATNFKPQVTGEDQALWRRIHLIPFKVVIPPEDRDGDLPEKLKAEMPGILNWAIEGAIEWVNGGLLPPKEVKAATSDYQSEMDGFAEFCNTMIIQAPGENTKKSELYDAFCGWCEEEGGQYLSKSDFTARMRRLDFKEGRNKFGRYWKDIRLDTDVPVDMDLITRV
jgi:putative DNA primase/helicase